MINITDFMQRTGCSTETAQATQDLALALCRETSLGVDVTWSLCRSFVVAFFYSFNWLKSGRTTVNYYDMVDMIRREIR